jgi:hypothetical protein
MEKYIKSILNKVYRIYEEFIDATLSAQSNTQINIELKPVTDLEKIAKLAKKFTEQVNNTTNYTSK